ncbi:MAG: GNAT family N-acetyltransferase [Dehalococcoidia bacterium]|jgi:predicted acetyltransferase
MGFEIRPIKPEELNEMNRIVRHSFAIPDETFMKMPPEWTLCAFCDGKMATTYAAWPLTMRLNGSAAPVAGVTIVGTLPAYRRRSYLRKVTAAHFQGLYERGDYAVAALFASRVAIYQRYGYAVVSTKGMYSVEPRNLNLIAGPEVPGEFREAGDEDTETILDLYHRFIEDKTGYLHRNKSFEVAEGSPLTVVRNFVPTNILVKVLYIEAGQPAGYIIYFIERDSRPGNVGGQRLNVTDLIWHSPMAYRAIWHYFRNMDLVQDVIWGRVPPDDPLPHIMLEPRELKLTSADGLLGRIVNVAGALPLRPYSDEGTLTFEIVDGFCEWNQGKWEMTATVGGAEVKHSNKSPQLTMPVSTLAMLMFGQISASAAARMGRLDVADGDALEMWDRVMRTKYPPFCADSF